MSPKFLSNEVLLKLLDRASDEERLILTKALDHSAVLPRSAESLQRDISRAGGHAFFNWVRGQGTGYIDILGDVVDALKIQGLPSYMGGQKIRGLRLWELDERSSITANSRDIEACRQLGIQYAELAEGKILLKLLEAAYQKLTPEQREIFDARVREVAARFGSSPMQGLAGSAGLLLVGNLGGFATYTLMSTILSTISLSTLGFGAYTAASSALSVVLGPMGWVALGVAGLYAYGKPKYQTIIPLVANVAMIRQRVNALQRH